MVDGSLTVWGEDATDGGAEERCDMLWKRNRSGGGLTEFVVVKMELNSWNDEDSDEILGNCNRWNGEGSDEVLGNCNRGWGGRGKFETGTAGLKVGSDDIDVATFICSNGTEGVWRSAIYAGINDGTTCRPLGLTTFSGGVGVNVLTTGANSEQKADEFGGNMRKAGGRRTVVETWRKSWSLGAATNGGSASLVAKSRKGIRNPGADVVVSSDPQAHH